MNYCGHTATAIQKKFEIHCLKPSIYDVCRERGGGAQQHDSAGKLAECESDRRGSKYFKLVRSSHQHSPRERGTKPQATAISPLPLSSSADALLCVCPARSHLRSLPPSLAPSTFSFILSSKVGQIHSQLENATSPQAVRDPS